MKTMDRARQMPMLPDEPPSAELWPSAWAKSFRSIIKRVTGASNAPSNDGGITAEIEKEERDGLRYIFIGRIIVLTVLAAWASTLPFERSMNYLLALAAFTALSVIQYAITARLSTSMLVPAAFVVLDAVILTYILVVPPPFYVDGWTAQINSRLPNFLYLGIYLASMALSYSPGLVLWAGAVTSLAWTVGFIWLARLPDSVLNSSRVLDGGMTSQQVIDSFLDPATVSVTTLYTQLIFLLITTLILTLTVWRSRRLVRRNVAAESERGRLSRYFSPNIVEELSTKPDIFDRPLVQPVAVLFADMVGFTSISENMEPAKLVELLREFHGRLAQSAFANGGTVDKFIGDSIMVHFGTPRSQPDDPVRALACAADMIRTIDEWNEERSREGLDHINIGIGVHYGEVLVGSVGHAQRLEYTVLGDTVNVASRLERLTRRIGARLTISDSLVQAVRFCGVEPTSLVPDLQQEKTRKLRGRYRTVSLWSSSAF